MSKKDQLLKTPKEIARMIMREHNPSSFKEVSGILKEIYAPVLEEMLQGELDDHLGYTSGSHANKETTNRRNGYIFLQARPNVSG